MNTHVERFFGEVREFQKFVVKYQRPDWPEYRQWARIAENILALSEVDIVSWAENEHSGPDGDLRGFFTHFVFAHPREGGDTGRLCCAIHVLIDGVQGRGDTSNTWGW